MGRRDVDDSSTEEFFLFFQLVFLTPELNSMCVVFCSVVLPLPRHLSLVCLTVSGWMKLAPAYFRCATQILDVSASGVISIEPQRCCSSKYS